MEEINGTMVLGRKPIIRASKTAHDSTRQNLRQDFSRQIQRFSKTVSKLVSPIPSVIYFGP